MTTTATPTTTPTTTATKPWRPPQQGGWSYDDYARMPDTEGVHYEVVEGNLYLSPSPRPRHQIVIRRLTVMLDAFVIPRGGEVLLSPCDVRLHPEAGVVQPDIVVIKPEKLSIVLDRYVLGVPDLLVEVLSPSNPEHDQQRKWKLYLQHRVPEYWIVDTEEDWLEPWLLRGDAYASAGRYRRGQAYEADVLPGFTADLAKVFQR